MDRLKYLLFTKGYIMGKMFGGSKPPPIPKPQPLPVYEPPPEPEPVAEAPVPDDKSFENKKKKKLALESKRSGRASTIFTDEDSGKLG